MVDHCLADGTRVDYRPEIINTYKYYMFDLELNAQKNYLQNVL